MKFSKIKQIKNFFKNKGGRLKMKTNKERNQLKNNAITASEQRSFVKTIKKRIYGVNKVLAILGFLIVAGALLVIGGNVVVKDGQLNVTSNLFVDTNTLYVDSSNNRVGILTTSPGKELEVAGRINGTELNISGNANLAYGSGNVGIGMTSPKQKLHVDGNVNITGNLTTGTFKFGSFTYDLSTASGTQAITGVGFQPTIVEVWYYVIGSGNVAGMGIDIGTSQFTFFNDNARAANRQIFDTSMSIIAMPADSNYQSGQISSMDADGFTYTWTKTVSPTGTLNVYYRAYQ